MKIGNIIYENELVNHNMVDYINYYKNKISYDELDKSLPTLYVGWTFMKSCNSNNSIIQNADILKKKIITNELYWEFSFEESKASHVKGIDNFTNLVPQFYFSSKYQYINLDPVFFQIKDIQDLMDILPKKIDSLYNYKNEMLYLLLDNKISGINLNMYNFFKFSTDDILEKISERTETIHLDLEGNIYQFYYKKLPNFEQLKRYIIVILSK